MKILYVDDQPNRARQLEQLLRPLDMQLVHIASSARAVTLLKRNRSDFDAVLLNLNLSGAQGLKALVHMLEQVPGLPVIALCDQLDHDLARRAIRAGAQDVLPRYLLNSDLLQRVINYALERKQAEESLLRRDEILKAISIIANLLLYMGNFEEVITEALALLGKATNASRVNLFIHHPAKNGDDLRFSLRYEWDAPGIPNLLSGGLFENRPASGTLIGEWWPSLEANQVVHARRSKYSPEAWAVLPEDTLSILIAPIKIRDSVWGTVEFNDCAVERVWSLAEIEALQTAASLLAAGIQHHEMLEGYRALVDHSLQELLIIQDNRVVYANPAAVANIAPLEHLRQSSPEELQRFIHPEDRPMLLQSMDGWEQWTVPVKQELRLLKPDGSVRWVEFLAARITYQNRPALQVALLDLTERKEIENALQRSAESMRTLFEHFPSVVARYDRNLRYQYINRAVEELLDIPAERFIGKTQREVGFPEQLVKQWEGALRRVFERGEEVLLEYEQDTPHGRVTREAHLLPEFSSDGSVDSILAVSMDITERKRVQRELEKALDELQMIASSISDVLWVGEFNPQGNYHITYVSPVMEKLTGHPSEFFLRDPGNWLSIVHPEDRQKVVEMDQRAYHSNLEEIEGEYRLIDASGRLRWVRDNIRIIR
ncbi:MAG: PAS domain S-box protein, partial [Anaerolineales bacterium]